VLRHPQREEVLPHVQRSTWASSKFGLLCQLDYDNILTLAQVRKNYVKEENIYIYFT